MKIVSVNRGAAESIGNTQSGIHKVPVAGPVAVRTLGLEGDVIVDQRYHGGADQAVYVYRAEDYAWWSEGLGRALEPGRLGENLTIEGIPGPDVPIGARIRCGDVELEVTAARVPCGKVAAHVGERDFIQLFVEAERPGMYCRVLSEGTVTAGDTGTFEAGDGAATIVELFRAHYEAPSPADLERLLSTPLAHRMRESLEEAVCGPDST